MVWSIEVSTLSYGREGRRWDASSGTKPGSSSGTNKGTAFIFHRSSARARGQVRFLIHASTSVNDRRLGHDAPDM